jgi:hypothetical protein
MMKKELIVSTKNKSSKINLLFADNDIETITFYNQVDGDIFPETELPETGRVLRGLAWRVMNG